MRPHDWTSRQKEILERLLEECEAESLHYVESKRFRKRNFSDIEDIEALVNRGFIQDKNARYSVDVLCLSKLESELALKIRSDADLLWRVYREEYLRDESDKPFLSTVAKAAGVSMEDAQRALYYMMQTNWHRGCETQADGLYKSVVIGEEVLRYGSFSDYLDRLYKQHSELPRMSAPFDVSKFLVERQHGSNRLRVSVEADLPTWMSALPEGVQGLLAETFRAKEQGWNRLAAMGCRTLFDMVSTEALTGDAKTFKDKLDAMVQEAHIAETQKENLGALVEAGNAAAHRGFNPEAEMVETMWGIALNLLESHFVLRPKAQKLSSLTPPKPGSAGRKAPG